ncbi:TPA: hypothetical protein ACGIY5_000971 [Corynebacterium striatum]
MGGNQGAGTEAEAAPEEDHLLDGPYGLYDPRAGAYGDDDTGGGPYDPETGLRDWYAPTPAEAQKPVGAQQISWLQILEAWNAIECDLHTIYHIDVESGDLQHRTWRWLEIRIADLINQPSRLRQALSLTSEITK